MEPQFADGIVHPLTGRPLMKQVPGSWISDRMFERLVHDLARAPLVPAHLLSSYSKAYRSLGSGTSTRSLNRRRHNGWPLSPMQLQAVQGLADGKVQKVIAAEMGIAYRSVQEHLGRARAKTGCVNNEQLVARAVAAEIVSVRDPLDNINLPKKLVVRIAGREFTAQEEKPVRDPRAFVNHLAEHELAILEGFAEGLSYREIAEHRSLSAETVKSYAKSLRQKLGAKSAAHAVSLGYRNGILT